MKQFLLLFPVLFAALILSGCIAPTVPPEPIPRACTADAKLCSDGTGVGRIGELDCEFSPCREDLVIVLDPNSILQGAQIGFSLSNALPYPVFLPGCNEFVVEQLSGTSWQTIIPKECVWEGISVEIKPRETSQFFYQTQSAEPGTYRFSFDASFGCSAGKPLSEANCIGSVVAKSKEFSIETGNLESCASDSDCLLVDAGCCNCNYGGSRIAINKNFEQSYKQSLLQRCVEIACPAVISNDPSCQTNAKAVCQSGKCAVQTQ